MLNKPEYVISDRSGEVYEKIVKVVPYDFGEGIRTETKVTVLRSSDGVEREVDPKIVRSSFYKPSEASEEKYRWEVGLHKRLAEGREDIRVASKYDPRVRGVLREIKEFGTAVIDRDPEIKYLNYIQYVSMTEIVEVPEGESWPKIELPKRVRKEGDVFF